MTTIQTGDVMIKHQVEGDTLGKVIRAGQLLSSGPSVMVHAGIAYSPTKIIEMDGQGLQRNLLSSNGEHGYRYDVFRCKSNQLARGAAAVADLMWRGVTGDKGGGNEPLAPGMKIQYSAKAAACSVLPSVLGMFGLVTADQSNNVLAMKWVEALSGGGASFFCSEHVVLCYQISGRQIRAHYKQLKQNKVLKKLNKTGIDVVLKLSPESVPAPRVNGEVKVNEVFEEDSKNYGPGYLWKELWEDAEVWTPVGEFQGATYLNPIKEK